MILPAPLLIPLCFVLLLACAYSAFILFERSRIFKPIRVVGSDPSAVGLAFEEIQFIAEDGVILHGWWVEAEKAPATILYFHGSAGNIGDRIETVQALHRLGLHIFLFDYRGYGQSRGFPSEKGTYRDARAAYEVVRARYADVDEPPVLFYGRSLGAAIAIRLAGERHTQGLITEAAFTSIPDLGSELFPALPVRSLGRIKYDSLSRISRLTAPLLLAHSLDDILIPFEHGKRLHEAASEPKQFVELRGAHAEPGWLHTPAYWEILKTFVAANTMP
jgi:hypothetical protein